MEAAKCDDSSVRLAWLIYHLFGLLQYLSQIWISYFDHFSPVCSSSYSYQSIFETNQNILCA